MSEKKKKNSAVWTILRIINYLALIFYAVTATLLMKKVLEMKVLPSKYVVVILLLMVLLVVVNIWLRKNKAVNIIFTLLCIGIGAVCIFGYQVVGEVDKVIDQVTEGADIEVTVMEIRVLAENNASSMLELNEYTIGFMKERDRKYADKVVKEISKVAGDGFETVAFEDDPIQMVNALYNLEVDAIIISSVYANVFEEVEGYTDFATKTKVLDTVEIEEKIATRKEQNANAEKNTEPATTEPSTSDGNSNGGGYVHDYGQYGEWGGGFVYQEPTSPAEMSKSAFIVYISGIDTFGNVNVRSRSDVNILAAVNTETKKVVLINTPRDYYVPLSVSNGVRDKLTHAGNFGVECSRDTLGMLYGVTADYYVRMNFTGFIDIIDAIGGVDVHSDYAFSAGGRNFTAGMNTGLTGRQALAFARERYQFASGDRQRGKNQMAVISAMIKKMATPEIVTNYKAVLEAIAGSFQTNFTSAEIYALVQMQIGDMASWTVETYSVDGTGAMLPTFSIPGVNLSVMQPDMNTVAVAREKIKAVLLGQ